MANNYQGTFSDFDYDYVELGQQLGDKWEDMTWKNDSCPKYTIMKDNEANVWYDLWFDYADFKKSENPDSREQGIMKRFTVTDEFGDVVFETENWEEMKDAILVSKIVDNHFDNRVEREALERQSEG